MKKEVYRKLVYSFINLKQAYRIAQIMKCQTALFGNWTICFAMQNVLTQAQCGFNRKLGTT